MKKTTEGFFSPDILSYMKLFFISLSVGTAMLVIVFLLELLLSNWLGIFIERFG